MARIRTIKPEFPQSESMGRVSRDARLLFIMLWTIADDSGRARASSRMLASLLFPYDDDAALRIPEWLMELERQNCVTVYEIDGNTYLQIEKWASHQRIDRPTPSRISPAPSKPKPRERSRKPRDNAPNARDNSQPPREASPPEGKGRDLEGKGTEKSIQTSSTPSEAGQVPEARPTIKANEPQRAPPLPPGIEPKKPPAKPGLTVIRASDLPDLPDTPPCLDRRQAKPQPSTAGEIR